MSLSLRECIAAPDLAWQRGIIEPLCSLRRIGKLACQRAVILVDALCEAEYHRPDAGDTLAGFLSRHAPTCPPWIKFILTVRTHLDEVMPPLPFHRLRWVFNYKICEKYKAWLVLYIKRTVFQRMLVRSNLFGLQKILVVPWWKYSLKSTYLSLFSAWTYQAARRMCRKTSWITSTSVWATAPASRVTWCRAALVSFDSASTSPAWRRVPSYSLSWRWTSSSEASWSPSPPATRCCQSPWRRYTFFTSTSAFPPQSPLRR